MSPDSRTADSCERHTACHRTRLPEPYAPGVPWWLEVVSSRISATLSHLAHKRVIKMFLLQPFCKKKLHPKRKCTVASKRSVEYFLRIDIINILSYSPSSLFQLMVTCRRLHTYLKHHDTLWLVLLARLRGDCAVCWHEGQEFCRHTGTTNRDELTTRIAHICARREWRVRFSSRVFTLPSEVSPPTSPSILLSPIILAQKEAVTLVKRVCRKSNQVAPVQSLPPAPL